MTDALIGEVLATLHDKSLSELQTCVAKIESEIHTNVTKHHNDLLAQTSNVEQLDEVVGKTMSRTKNCVANIRTTGASLEKLHRKLEVLVTKLDNLYTARQKVTIFEKVLKLNALIEGERNLADIAKYVETVEYLCINAKLQKLSPYNEKANSLSQNIEKQTENMMMQGLVAGSFNQVSSALQILVNLKKVDIKIEKILNDLEKQVSREVKHCLLLQKSNEKPAGVSQPGRASSLASKLSDEQQKLVWSNLESFASKLVSHTNKVKFLAHVMKTGKDLNTNCNFNSFVDESIMTKFWNGVLDALIRNLGSTEHEGIKLLFQDDFPKLLSIISTMGNQIEDCTGLNTTVRLKSGLRGVTLNYEKAFLSKSLAKLFDAVNHMFVSCPTQSEVDSLVDLINKSSNLEDVMLRKLVARNITKTVQLVCVRVEQLIVNDGAATQVIGPATEAQMSNGRLVCLLDYFKSKLETENHEPITTLMENIISPLVQAIAETVEAIILTIHQENFKRTSRTTEYSLYMGELSNFLQRVAKDYLRLFGADEAIRKSCHQLSSRTIRLLVINITLVSNLDFDTRKLLVLDLNHTEVALVPICPLSQDELRYLRTFKSLLRMDVEQIKGSNLIGSVIPYSLVLHLILNQTHKEIKAPNVVNKWSIPRYLRWLEDHSEKEKLTLLKSCVEGYVQSVNAKGQAKFHPYYPIILDLIKSAHE